MRNRGFTLVEIIFALAIEIMVLGVILSAYLIDRNNFEKETIDLKNTIALCRLNDTNFESARRGSILERAVLSSGWGFWTTYDPTPLNDTDQEITSHYYMANGKLYYESNKMDDYYLAEGQQDPTPEVVIINESIYRGYFDPIDVYGGKGVLYQLWAESSSTKTGQKSKIGPFVCDHYGRNDRDNRNHVFK